MGAEGSSYEAPTGAPRLLLMEDPNELYWELPKLPEVAHTELPEGIPWEFLEGFIDSS